MFGSNSENPSPKATEAADPVSQLQSIGGSEDTDDALVEKRFGLKNEFVRFVFFLFFFTYGLPRPSGVASWLLPNTRWPYRRYIAHKPFDVWAVEPIWRESMKSVEQIVDRTCLD